MVIVAVDSEIISDNEAAARRSYDRRDYVQCFLLMHSLVESLLRAFLGRTGKQSFSALIAEYQRYLEAVGQDRLTFVDELTKFNKRRNRVVHDLWTRGYSATNKGLASACRGAILMFGLFIEWLETFDDEITQVGFRYE